MDLKIKITDEDGYVLDVIMVYQDGSDSDGAEQIRRMITDVYDVEEES